MTNQETNTEKNYLYIIDKLKQQIKDIRDNKPKENFERLEQIKEGIEEEIAHAISRDITDVDELQELADRRTHEEIENFCIYYSECWAICSQDANTDFEIDQTGENAKNICQLAFWTLQDLFVDRYDTAKIIQEHLTTK